MSIKSPKKKKNQKKKILFVCFAVGENSIRTNDPAMREREKPPKTVNVIMNCTLCALKYIRNVRVSKRLVGSLNFDSEITEIKLHIRICFFFFFFISSFRFISLLYRRFGRLFHMASVFAKFNLKVILNENSSNYNSILRAMK